MSAEVPGGDGTWMPAADQSPGSPGWQPRPRPVWARRPVIFTAVAAVALLGGAGAAYAATTAAGSPAVTVAPAGNAAAAPSSAASTPGLGHRRYGAGLGLGLGIGGGMAGAVHGQLVVPKSGGGYQTVDVQSGQVTAVSGTSITVKSADGFSQQYAVTSSTIVDAKRDTISKVKTGDQVFVVATVSGSTTTAAGIMDRNLVGQGHPGGGFGGWRGNHDGPGMPGTSGTPGSQPPPL